MGNKRHHCGGGTARPACRARSWWWRNSRGMLRGSRSPHDQADFDREVLMPVPDTGQDRRLASHHVRGLGLNLTVANRTQRPLAAVAWLRARGRDSAVPGVRLERCLQWRLRDAGGIVGDRRGGDHRDHFEQVILAEAGGEETLGVLISRSARAFRSASAPGSRARRACYPTVSGRRGSPRHPPDRVPPSARERVWNATGQAEAFVTALVRSRVWICASVKLPPWTRPNRPTRLLMSTGDVAMTPAMLGIIPNAACRSRSAGFEPSGAELIVWTGKFSI